MGDIIVHLVDMPDEFRGHVNENPDGSYSVYINAKLNYESQRMVYMHELGHIENGDLNNSDADVDEIEFKAHKRKGIF